MTQIYNFICRRCKEFKTGGRPVQVNLSHSDFMCFDCAKEVENKKRGIGDDKI